MPAAPAGGEVLRVLSYNIHGQRDDVAAMADLVRSLSPDVALIQEAPRRLRWRTRCADLAYRFGLIYAAGGMPGLGNLVLVGMRIRVTNTWCVRFPLTPGRHLRGAALARCVVAGRPFVAAGSHLSTDGAERPAQATLLAAELSGLTDPVIAGVDVNETADGPAWRPLTDGRCDAATAARRADAATFPAQSPRRRIDALFVDPRIEVREYHVVETEQARRASDHLPIVADLVLPPASH